MKNATETLNGEATMNVINKQWILAGEATFTVQPNAAAVEKGFKPHYTYRVERVEMPASGKFPAKVCYFVKVLTGQDNTNDYTYVGMVCETTGGVKLTAKSAFPADAKRVRVLQAVLPRVWAGEVAVIEATGWKVTHAGKCAKCGKKLTVPESIETGYGPECVKVVTGYSMKQYAAMFTPATTVKADLLPVGADF